VLRLQYQREVSQSHVTVQTKFNYAWGLIKSPKREHQVEGVGILQGTPSSVLVPLPINPFLQISTATSRFVGENVFTTSLWDTTRWGTMNKPRASLVRISAFPCPSNRVDVAKGLLLEKEPSNLQAQSLNNLIEDKATRGKSPPKRFRALANILKTDT
jgi:hypothetical protein